MIDFAALSPDRRKALDSLAAILGVAPDSLTPDCSITTHAKWDSHAQLEIMLYLSQEKEIELSEDNILRYSTMNNIIEIF